MKTNRTMMKAAGLAIAITALCSTLVAGPADARSRFRTEMVRAPWGISITSLLSQIPWGVSTTSLLSQVPWGVSTTSQLSQVPWGVSTTSQLSQVPWGVSTHSQPNQVIWGVSPNSQVQPNRVVRGAQVTPRQ